MKKLIIRIVSYAMIPIIMLLSISIISGSLSKTNHHEYEPPEIRTSQLDKSIAAYDNNINEDEYVRLFVQDYIWATDLQGDVEMFFGINDQTISTKVVHENQEFYYSFKL